MTFWKEHFSLLRKFFRSDFRRLLSHCAIGMAIACLIGVVVGLRQPDVVEEALSMFMEVVEDAGVVDKDGNFSVFALLQNNWTAMLMAVTYGFLPFIYLPLISLLSNGFVIGIMAAWYQTEGMGLPLLLAGLIPHGIFEIPALVLSIACGVHLCTYMTHRITGRSQRTMAEVCEELLRVIVLAVAPLVVAAAFVECYITPVIMQFFA